MIRIYKNRQACFYRRMTAARMAQQPFTKVTSPKSIVSANSTTGAYFIFENFSYVAGASWQSHFEAHTLLIFYHIRFRLVNPKKRLTRRAETAIFNAFFIAIGGMRRYNGEKSHEVRSV